MNAPARPPAAEAPFRTARAAMHEDVLPTGLRVQVVRRGTVPLVRVRLQVPRRRRSAPATAAVELAVAAAAWDSGVAARRVARAGGTVAGWTTAEHVSVDGYAVPTAVAALLTRVAEVATVAPAPSPALDRVRRELADRLAATARDPGLRAAAALHRLRFGDHPGLAPPDPGAVSAVPSAALDGALAGVMRPDGAVLVVVGDVDPDAVLELARAAFGGWTAGEPAERLTLPAATESGRGVHLAGPDAALLRLTTSAPPHGGRDSGAFQLVTLALGGYFGSRLVRTLRHTHGLAYSVQAGPDAVSAVRSLTVDVRVHARDAERALQRVRDEVTELAASGPAPAELDGVRRYALGRLTASASTQALVVEGLARLALLGLPHDWAERHGDRLAAATTAEVADTAARLGAADWSHVLVGGRPDDDEEATQ